MRDLGQRLTLVYGIWWEGIGGEWCKFVVLDGMWEAFGNGWLFVLNET